MTSPLVSIIIPCYNYGNFLPDAITSVENQTFKNWEIIIADDGSDESTIQVLKSFEVNPRIKILYLKNGGPGRARNSAIKVARGKYILPLDADDIIRSTYLQKGIQLLEGNSDLRIVTCEAEFFGVVNEKWNLPEYRFPDILLDNCIFVSSLFKKLDWEKVGGFDESFEEWEDFDFWLKLIELGGVVYRIPEILFYYRKGHSSRSRRNNLEFLPVFERLIKNHRVLYSENSLFFIKKILEEKEKVFLQIQECERIIQSKEFRAGYYFFHFFDLLFNKILKIFKPDVKIRSASDIIGKK